MGTTPWRGSPKNDRGAVAAISMGDRRTASLPLRAGSRDPHRRLTQTTWEDAGIAVATPL